MPDQNRSTANDGAPPSWSSSWEQIDAPPRDEPEGSADNRIGKAHAATPGYEGQAHEEADEKEEAEEASEADENADEARAGVDKNEGEGNRTAARRYAAGVKRTVQQGDVEEHAAEAAEALDGPEGDELKRAEQQAKRGPIAATPRH